MESSMRMAAEHEEGEGGDQAACLASEAHQGCAPTLGSRAGGVNENENKNQNRGKILSQGEKSGKKGGGADVEHRYPWVKGASRRDGPRKVEVEANRLSHFLQIKTLTHP